MARIDGIRRMAASPRAAERPHAPPHDDIAAAETGRALTVVEPARQVMPPTIGSSRVSAGFLAHLIAIDQQAPQTRVRRRAEPTQALLAYRAALASPAPPAGRLLSKAS